MKVVILAGGKGTRISEESQFKPKPMIENTLQTIFCARRILHLILKMMATCRYIIIFRNPGQLH